MIELYSALFKLRHYKWRNGFRCDRTDEGFDARARTLNHRTSPFEKNDIVLVTHANIYYWLRKRKRRIVELVGTDTRTTALPRRYATETAPADTTAMEIVDWPLPGMMRLSWCCRCWVKNVEPSCFQRNWLVLGNDALDRCLSLLGDGFLDRSSPVLDDGCLGRFSSVLDDGSYRAIGFFTILENGSGQCRTFVYIRLEEPNNLCCVS